MSVVFILLKTWYRELIIVALIAMIWGFYHHITSEIAGLRANVVTLQTVNGVLKDNNDKLQLAITNNNATIDKISAGADATKAGFATLNQTVATSINALQPKLASILNSTKPVGCPNTLQYLLDARKGYGK